VQIKVYYGDTDAGGVVYYANYLRWLEAARMEFVDDLGLSVVEYAKDGVIFAVARIEVDYRIPARLGDIVEVVTSVERVRRVRFTVRQQVLRASDSEEMVDSTVTLACVDPQGKLQALPDLLADSLRDLL